nr:MFS transporter [Actinoplanes maris]
MVIPAGALLWGLQFAFLNPALALLLVTVYDAGPGEVGWALAIYNTGGFVASLLVPAYADRAGDYLRPTLACGVLTLALAGALAATTSLPVAVLALVVLGGPAGVGSSLLFAHLKHTGAAPGEVVRTRALVSVAWVAGPPLATAVIAASGARSILAAIAVIALLNIGTTAAMRAPKAVEGDAAAQPRAVLSGRVIAVVVVFIALQATNSATVSIMSLFVTGRMGLDVAWSGVTLGVAAALEIPALLLIGKLSNRFASANDPHDTSRDAAAAVRLPGRRRLLRGHGFCQRPGSAARLAGAQRLVLRRRRGCRPDPVPGADPAPGAGLRSVRQHPPAGRCGLRTADRRRINDRARLRRSLPGLGRDHRGRPGRASDGARRARRKCSRADYPAATDVAPRARNQAIRAGSP